MILLNDFQAEPEELIQAQLVAVEKVIRSGWYILGQQVSNFESIWANQCGVDFAIGVGNGMDAIEIGLRSLNLTAGDEVITTPMTAFATVLAIIRAGATPILADIDPETGLLDPVSVERCLSSRTKAVLLVHLYGQLRQIDRWIEICDRAKISLLEDCAQAHYASWEGRVAGSFGVLGAYSFYPTKNLGALGDGGALITNCEAIAKSAKTLRNYGQSERYHHPELGLNSRLDEIQAALLSVRLQWLENFTTRRRAIAKAYFQGITNPKIKLLAQPKSIDHHVYHLFVILCEQRDKLSHFLKEKGIAALSHYPIPIHYQKPCLNIKRDTLGLTNAEFHANHCLSIPCHPQMSDENINYVIEAINEYK